MSSKQDKQQYLYAQIIDGGFDPEEFQEFLQVNRPDGLDISKWEIQQLIKVVEEFKKSKAQAKVKQASKQKFGQRVINIPKKEEKIQKKSQQPDTPIHKVTHIEQSPQKRPSKPIKSQNNQGILKVQKTNTQQKQLIQTIQAKQLIVQVNRDRVNSSGSVNNQDVFSKTIDCIKTIPNEIFTKDIQVKIQRFEKMQGGFFQQGYVQYRIVTASQMWAVMRRYTDFEWLRTQLIQRHPGYPIPPIAKKGTFRKFDEQYLNKRKVILQNFINKILSIPELKAEQIVQDFLKIDDPISYIKSKKQKQIKQDKIKLQKVSSLKGKVNMVIDPTITKYMAQVQKYITATEPKLQKIYQDWKNLSISFQNSSKLLKQLSNSFDHLKKDQAKFYFATEPNMKKQIASLYKLLEKMTSQWADIMEQQAKTINTQLYGVYKYEYINLISLSEAVKHVHMQKNEYFEYKFKIQKLKEKLYDDRNFARMELPTPVFDKVTKNRQSIPKPQLFALMLPKDFLIEQKLKQSYALSNFQCYQQVQRYFHQNPKSLSRVIQQLATRQSSNTSKSMILWVDTITDSMSLKEGRLTQQFEMGA